MVKHRSKVQMGSPRYLARRARRTFAMTEKKTTAANTTKSVRILSNKRHGKQEVVHQAVNCKETSPRTVARNFYQRVIDDYERAGMLATSPQTILLRRLNCASELDPEKPYRLQTEGYNPRTEDLVPKKMEKGDLMSFSDRRMTPTMTTIDSEPYFICSSQTQDTE